jgi:hypothetical protein
MAEPTPGNETSEYALAKYVMIFGAVLDAVSVLLSKLHESFPQAQWLVVALAVVGALVTLAGFLGYNKGRVIVKTAATPSVVVAAEAKPNP